MKIQSENAMTIVEPMSGWRVERSNGVACHVAGKATDYKNLIHQVLADNAAQHLTKYLLREKNFFGCVLSSPHFIFAAVDRVKSYPVYYGFDASNQFFVSNCPYSIKKAANLTTINEKALLEYSMSSYVFGSNTLYESLYQLQAGEYLLWLREKREVIIFRYYRYLPAPERGVSIEALKREYADLMDRVIQRSIEKANGRPIWVPLSAGLDSRIILAKLVEKRYDQIQTFSYGLRGNFEAKKAKQIAKRLQVPWYFVPAKPAHARQLYQQPRTTAYAKLTSAFHTVPGYMEYEAFLTLKDNHLIPQNAFIINGQSGDFITGGHLPRDVFYKQTAATFEDFFEALVKKHCSCWYSLLTEKNLTYLKRRIIELLPETNPHLTLCENLLAQYESWEWQERQCKAVIKGQRLYDWLGFDWDLPLWDFEIMDFWQKVPFEWKINQKLYIAYLQEYNYKNLFSELRCVAKPWVARFFWIPFMAKFLGLIFGKKVKEAYYQRMYYYATDYYQYALIGKPYYLAHYKNARGLIPFLVSHSLERMGIIDQSEIADTKPILSKKQVATTERNL